RLGRSIDQIRADGWTVDAQVTWPVARAGAQALRDTASATGQVMAGLVDAYERLGTEIVLVVGDRVEAFAAASAGHLSGRVVAHVQGGERAVGEVDGTLRHAITKLSHLHFPATPGSAQRLKRLGEDAWRIHRVGSPGVQGLTDEAAAWSAV